MSKEIGRSLAEIDSKVKELNKSLGVSTNQTKELDRALKLNPKDAETAAKKMDMLKEAVGLATQKVALLKQKQTEANEAFKHGDISANEYKKIETAVVRAQNEVTKLNKEVRSLRPTEK